MRLFPLTIASVNEVHFDAEAVSLTVPGSDGELTVLADHESFVSSLKGGKITVRMEKEHKVFEIERGILEVHHGGVTVLL